MKLEHNTIPTPILLAKYLTLGCKLNFAETSSLADKLSKRGILRAQDGQRADLCIINTCTVTETSNHKCRQAIHRALRENPGALMVVMGCYAQLCAPEIAAMQGVDLVISMEDKARAPELIMAAFAERRENALREDNGDTHSNCDELQANSSESCSAYDELHHAYSGLPHAPAELPIHQGEPCSAHDELPPAPVELAASQGELHHAHGESSRTHSHLYPSHGEQQQASGGLHYNKVYDGLHRYSSVPRKDIRTFVPSCSRGERTRFFLKVQDGCDCFCTYCAIPFARGRSRNGSIQSMIEQAQSVVEQGGKEIVITGVNIGDFGRSTHETFFSLVKALDEVDGIERYRISSIEPDLLTDEIIDFCAASRRFMPHFHIPLQSGSDAVLRLMHRRYDTSLFRSRIEYIKKVMPDAFVGVDIIVGMRGETDSLFEESLDFATQIDVSQYHVFSYSERPGTAALRIPYAVSEQEKRRRSKAVIALSEQKRLAFYKSQLGRVRPILTEHAPHGWAARGFTDNYVRVDVPKEYGPLPINTIISCRLESVSPDGMALIGIPVAKTP